MEAGVTENASHESQDAGLVVDQENYWTGRSALRSGHDEPRVYAEEANSGHNYHTFAWISIVWISIVR